MKRNLLLLTVLFVAHICVEAQNEEQMVFKNDFRETSGGLGNLTSMYISEGWWSDANGEDAAIIRIKVLDMSVSEMKKISISGSANLGVNKKEFFENEQQWLISVSAGSNMFLQATHPTYGTSSRLNITDRLKPKTIYDVTLVNNKTSPIIVRSQPNGAEVYLDGDHKGVTPCNIPGQRHGNHELRLLYNGNSLVKEIYVEESNTVFEDFDFRERAKVNITSDPNGAIIYIDDVQIGKAPIYEQNIVLGAHTFKAVLNASQVDEQSINITKQTTIVALTPVKKGKVHITTKYGGRPVSATLIVDNKDTHSGKDAYDIILPYNQHKFRVDYGNRTKEKTIKVNKPEMNYEFKLSAKNDIVWPWQRDYQSVPIGITIGYVQKQLVTSGNGEKLKENGIWDDGEDKWLSGIQVGFLVQPCLSFGLGLRTGAFYEYYFSSNDQYDYNSFQEHNLYIPAHVLFRLPIGEKIAFNIHGGLGLNYVIAGALKADGYEDITDFYGEPGYPQKTNFAAEVGFGFRIGPVQIGGQYSFGLNNHNSYDTIGDGYKTVQNKLALNLSFVFGSK